MSEEQPSVEALDVLRRFVGWKSFVEDGRPEDGDVPPPGPIPEPYEAVAALDCLTAALERAERQRENWHEEYLQAMSKYLAAKARAQKAEAVVEAARELAASWPSAVTGSASRELLAPLVLALDHYAYDEPPTEQIPGAGQIGC